MKKLLGLVACVVVAYGVTLAFSEDREKTIAAWKCFSHGGGHCHCMDRFYSCASTSLKTLSSAQADFRANDRDGDGVNQFWRRDVAGLYTLAPGAGPAIRLIELSVAAADDLVTPGLNRYAVRSSKAGYWFRAIRHADEDPKSLDPNRFAYCAFPENLRAGKYMYIVDENNTIFRSEAAGRRGIDVYPTEEELKTSWSKLD